MAKEHDQNLDPISNEPGSHPVGTGLGAAAGAAAAGAAAGVVAGPAGAVAGGVAGAVVGGLGGKAAAEKIDPTAEEAYWRDNYQREPYVQSGRSFDDYSPAYRMGVMGSTETGGSFDEREQQMAAQWEAQRGQSTLDWPDARMAARAAWERAGRGAAPSAASQGAMRQTDSLADPVGAGGIGGSRGATAGAPASAASGDALGVPAEDPVTGEKIYPGKPDPLYANGDPGRAESHVATPSADDDAVDTLNDLLECCRDGEYGYTQCAEHVKAADVKEVMLRHAEHCRSGAMELEEHIRSLGGRIDEGGTVSGALHRGWVSVRGTLTGHSDQAMLDECERGEDAALARYRKALKDDLPASIRAMVERQMQGVQRNHDQIKALRDANKITR